MKHIDNLNDLFPVRPEETKGVTVMFAILSVERLIELLDNSKKKDLNKKEVTKKRNGPMRDLCSVEGLGFNCESFVVDTNDSIVDGRQRAIAHVACNKPMFCLLVTGVHPDAVYATDLRRSRNTLKSIKGFVSPIRRMEGETDVALVARLNVSGPNAQIRWLTPELAERIFPPHLARKLTKRQVQYAESIARDIKDGRWFFTGQTVKVGLASKHVIDGRLTCYAVQLTGIAIPVVIVFDLPDAYASTVNANRTASLGHRLHARGVQQPYAVAASLKMSYKYEMKNPEADPTEAEIYALYVRDPLIVRWISPSRRVKKIVRQKIFVAMMEIFGQKDMAFAKTYIDRLANTDVKSDMFHHLRNAIKENGGTTGGTDADLLAQGRFMILTWNSLVRGREDVRFRYSDDWPRKLLGPT